MNIIYDTIIPIIIIILGFSLLILTLFFYKKNEIFFGMLIPIPAKIKKEKDKTNFWILLIICIISSIIIIIAGFSMLFKMWS